MRLLIICQKVDEHDDLLGFFIGWIREFAKKAEKVYVICLGKGLSANWRNNLPENVEVISLGKEENVSRLRRWFNFYKILFSLLPKFDVIFSHMCPIYAVAASPVRLFGKKNTMWYAHGAVSLTLRIAVLLSNLVFTSSDKGCRIKSKKIKVVGQGIDTEMFSFSKTDGPRYGFLTVGRISPIKGYEMLIKAVEMIVKEYGPTILARVIGKEGMPSQKAYFEKLKQSVKDKNLEKNIEFLGSVPNREIAQYYQKARLFVNMSMTGSLDKTVLEAMACGTPVITCNEAYKDVLEDRFLYKSGDAKDLAEKMKIFVTAGPAVPPHNWRNIVTENHSLDKLIDKILKYL